MRADLTGANLTGANLATAVLRDADLTSANLRKAKLTSADQFHTKLDGALYAQLEEIGAELEAVLRKALPEARIARVGSLLTVFVADFPALFRRLRQGGVLLPPSQFEAWFLSAAHGEEEVSRTLDAARAG